MVAAHSHPAQPGWCEEAGNRRSPIGNRQLVAWGPDFAREYASYVATRPYGPVAPKRREARRRIVPDYVKELAFAASRLRRSRLRLHSSLPRQSSRTGATAGQLNILQTVVSSSHLSRRRSREGAKADWHTGSPPVRGLLRTLVRALRKYRLWSSLTAD